MNSLYTSDASPKPTSQQTYDVFLSFRGKDTRKGFTDHLYAALVRAGIHTFMDENEMRYGMEVGQECLKAIQESRFSIVILSKGYASSTWCLDELVHILDCSKTFGHTVLPVFYDIDPTDVQEQGGSFAESFADHERRFKDELEKVDRWRAAVKEVAYLKGIDLPNLANGHEAKIIDHIVKKILKSLDRIKLRVATYTVGLQSRAKKVIQLLNDSSKDICVVGIYGMGGIGKTAIAKEVYNAIFNRFEGSSFLENVREKISQKCITQIHRQLLSETLKRKYEKLYSTGAGVNVIQERLCCKRVLIVIDDIDEIDQVYKIVGNFNWLCSGSRVIITTRIKDLLPLNEFYQQYEVKELDDSDSLQLLCLHAFGKTNPTEHYLNCAKMVAGYAKGNPLALEVLGSSLAGEDVHVWESRLKKLKVISNKKVHSILEVSFDSLDDADKSLFLDNACFFIGKNKDYVMSILDGCNLYTSDGINTLKKKCLVKIGHDNRLVMHDLLRDMGREMVRREAPRDPGERSRLWNHEDVVDMLTTETGTKAVEGLILNLRETQLSWRTKTFKRMRRLRLLQLSNVCLTGSYEHISRNLRWLCCHEFPLESIPTDLCLENLVALDMRYSRLNHFSAEVKFLRKLKFLNLSYSHELTETPNFEGIPSLEKLVLKDCISLVEIDDSIGFLKDLTSLNLKGCKNLKKLPDNVCALQSLEKLNLSGCFKIDELPHEFGNIKSLTMLVADGTSIKRLPETIGNMENLKSLSFCECHVILPHKEAVAVVNVASDFDRTLNCSQWSLPSDAIPQTLYQNLTFQGDLRAYVKDSFNLEAAATNLYLPESYKTPSDRSELLSRLYLKSSKGALKIRDCPLQSIDLTNFPREPEILELDGIRSLDVNNSMSKTDSLGVKTIEELLTTNGSSLSINTLNKIFLFNQTSSKDSPLKAVSKRGMNSTFLLGSEIPRWFSHKSEGRHISIHVPALTEDQGSRITAVLTCAVYSWKASSDACQLLPCISANNRTKVFEWQYFPSGTFVLSEANEDNIWICLLSYHNDWKGTDDLERSWGCKDEIDPGDHMEFSVDMGEGIDVKKFGLHLVWD